MIEATVWGALRRALADPEILVARQRQVQESLQKRQTAGALDLEGIAQERAKLAREESRLLEAYSGEVITLEQMRPQMEKLRARKKEIEDRAKASADLVHPPDLKDFDAMRQAILRGLDVAEGDPAKRQEILRLLVEQIRVEEGLVRIVGAIPAPQDGRGSVHNPILVGPPGSGKTMLARRMPGVLPPLTFEESLQATKIHSVFGALPRGEALLSTRPFRAPHHTISHAALVGGGAHPRPGEASLAHLGVLFLDELPEFRRDALEALRQPLEDGTAAISRANWAITFPARFMLVAAMNPCPCGYLGHPDRPCVCTPFLVQKYRAKVSGPLLDRIDLHVEVPALKLSDLTDEAPPSENSEAVRRRVLAARARQTERFGPGGPFANGDMSPRHMKAHAPLSESSKTLLKEAVQRLGLSARAFDRIVKVSRTVADLAGERDVRDEHVAEAVGYRTLDRAPMQV
jgi:Mg-chelatase subunit ChlI